MEALLNHNITIHLKNTKVLLSGTLVDFDDEHMYLQADRILIVPKENIIYYSMDNVAAEVPEPEPQESAIKVFINGAMLTKILVPPTMNLASASEEVLRAVWANADVQNALRGKVQKTLEYAPGEVNIILMDAMPSNPEQQDEAFSMGGAGSPLSTYLSPSDMVSRLANAGKKEKKNE